MSSAQVLPNPGAASARKQGHLAAGKRLLEEFRKNKANQNTTKKAASTGQLRSSDVNLLKKSPHESLSGGTKDDRDITSTLCTSGFVTSERKHAVEFSQHDEEGTLNGALTAAANINCIHSVNEPRAEMEPISLDSEQPGQNRFQEETTIYESSSSGLPNGYSNQLQEKINRSKQNSDWPPNKVETPVDIFQTRLSSDNGNKTSQSLELPDTSLKTLFDNFKFVKQPSKGVDGAFVNYSTSDINDGSRDKGNYASFNTPGRRISDSINRHLNIEDSSSSASKYSLTDENLTSRSSSGQYSSPATVSGVVSGRSRPSFLDSIISRASSSSFLPTADVATSDLPALNLSSDGPEITLTVSSQQPFANPHTFETPATMSADTAKEQEILVKSDDNFAALEQHIEDLTQEKFSLQRALDTSQSLAESLAAENSSLTDSFNQQGKVANQLKAELDQLQEEIKAQLTAFEALKMEYANAQLECDAADERAKILASEVINLEDKALRLRSNELKLEKQLENSNSEINSYRRKISSLEKENRDFKSTIEALREETKLLQSKLWKASSGKTTTNSDIPLKKDAHTSTDEIGSVGERDSAETDFLREMSKDLRPSMVCLPGDVSSLSSERDCRKFPLDSSGAIPDEQLKMIDNINSIISELALEKEALMKALVAESTLNSKLKDTNKELSQKLENQTQRLELLAAQQMANDNIHGRPRDPQSIQSAADYADEGDEVVERVLGWIIKLFPGGPAKRRTSKFL